MKRLPLLVLALLVVLSPVVAARGVGIKYNFEQTSFFPGKSNCLNYQVYNPWDEDVKIGLGATGDFESLFDKSTTTNVPANTASENALSLEICFDVPQVSGKKCSQTEYRGEIYAKDVSTLNSGSGAKTVASAPLIAVLDCGENNGPVAVSGGFVAKAGRQFFFGGILVSFLLFAVLLRQYARNPERKRRNYMNVYHEATRLQNDLMHDPFNQEKQTKYNSLLKKAYELRKKID